MLFKVNVQNEKRVLTVQEEIDLTGHGQKEASQEPEAAAKEYVPLRGARAALETKTHNMDLQSQKSVISVGSVKSNSSMYSLTQHHDRKQKREHLKKQKVN